MSIDESVRGPGTVPEPNPDELRSRAVKALKKRRDFKGHLLVYLMVNTFFALCIGLLGLGAIAKIFFWG